MASKAAIDARWRLFDLGELRKLIALLDGPSATDMQLAKLYYEAKKALEERDDRGRKPHTR